MKQLILLKVVCRGVVVITTAQLHSRKPGLRFCAGLNTARDMSKIRNGEDLWQWSRLEIRLNAFFWSTIPQKQIIIICRYWFFNHGFKFQYSVCNGCNDLTILSANISDIALILLKMLIVVVLFIALANLKQLIY